MKGRLAVAGLLLVATAQFGAWIFDNYNRVTREVFTGYSGEARYNPFLAAERLTQALGYEAASRAGLSPGEWLPPVTDTVVLADRHGTLSAVDIDVLLQWVGAGGSLVAAPNTDSDDPGSSLLFDALDVHVTYPKDDHPLPAPGNDACQAPCSTDNDIVGTPPQSETASGKKLPAIASPGATIDGLDIRVDSAQPRLRYPNAFDAAAGGDELGTFYLRFTYGAGNITLVADTLFINNRVVGLADNASLLTNLLRQAGGAEKVWFIYEDNYPAIAALIWQHAAPAVVAFSLLLALYLWRISRRFGPLLTQHSGGSRSVLEHILATGSLLWSTNNRQRLADAARGRLLQSLERHHPGVRHHSPAEQVQLLAEHTGQPVDEVANAFDGAVPTTPAEFTQRIEALQRLWKLL